MTRDVRHCPLCGATDVRAHLDTGKHTPEGEAYSVVTCGGCGLRYTRPLPTPHELSALYGEGYYVQNTPRLFSGDFVRHLFQQSVLWQHTRALLGRTPGRILDVGCGNGDFLAGLKRRGWQVQGTEFSTTAATIARNKGVTVHEGDLASAHFPADSFDVVTLWHVLEHVPLPQVDMAEIRRILHDDGLLVVEVPNSASFTFRLCREQWYPLDVPLHLQHFTPATLQQLLTGAGFSPVRRQNFHHWDFTYGCYSYMRRLGIFSALGIRTFSTNYKQASRVSKMCFFVLGLVIGLVSFPYSVIVTALTRNGETVTITSRKAAL